MGRRGCDSEAVPNPEPPKKRTRTVSENHTLNSSLNIEQPLPPGVILTDVSQKEWRIGKPIGCGSFGQIYLASDDVGAEVTAEGARYVLKVEPHSNGPLFVELHCLVRTARHVNIKSWQEQRKLKSLGMPHFIANGSHVLRGERHRFLVLPRYHCDLHKLARATGGRLHPRNVLVLAAQIMDVLEYLHAKGYTHSDIKSSNLMLGCDGDKFKDQRNYRYMLPPSAPRLGETQNEFVVKKSHHKTTYSRYYEDEDFDLKNCESSDLEESDFECERRRCRTGRNARTKTAAKTFNLRKQKSSVNYGDENSSICSDSSHIKSSTKSEWYFSDEGYHEGARSKRTSECNDDHDEEVDYFEESIATQTSGQIYLLDYGLASKFLNSDGTHKEFGMDQRKAHDGTLEYSSRDSHIGAHSRRSDLENLAFNILDWLTGFLPWRTASIMEDPDLVHAVKKNYMNDIERLLETCFKTKSYPTFMEKYLRYVNQLEFTQKPDYAYCKSLFVEEFVHCNFGSEEDMLLDFGCEWNMFPQKKKNYSKKIGRSGKLMKNTSPEFLKRSGIAKPSGRENFIMNSWENSFKLDLLREELNLSNDGNRKPCASRNFYVSDSLLIAKLRHSLLPILDTPSKKFSPKNLRSKKIIKKKRKGAKNKRSSIGKFGNFLGSGKQYTWAEILAGNPEDIIRKVDKEKTSNDASAEAKNPRSRKVSNASEVSLANDVNASPNLLRKDFLHNRNPTYAMKQVVSQYRRKISGKPLPKPDLDQVDLDAKETHYTYAMLMVLRNKEKRLKKEQLEEKLNKNSQEFVVRSCRLKKLETGPSPAGKCNASNKKIRISRKTVKADAVEERKSEEESDVSACGKKHGAVRNVRGQRGGARVGVDSDKTDKTEAALTKPVVVLTKRRLSSMLARRSPAPKRNGASDGASHTASPPRNLRLRGTEKKVESAKKSPNSSAKRTLRDKSSDSLESGKSQKRTKKNTVKPKGLPVTPSSTAEKRAQPKGVTRVITTRSKMLARRR